MQSKNWCFTTFKDEVEFFNNEKVKYIIFGNEKCPKTKKWHKQGYVQFKNRMRMTGLKKIDNTAHWERQRGTVKEAIEYCKKDGDFFESGKPDEQGNRQGNEFKIITDMVRNKQTEEIENSEYFGTYIRYKRTFDSMIKYCTDELNEPRGYWIHGLPGSGKDGNVMKLKPFVKSHNKWWDGYEGQEYILMSDFTQEDLKYLATYLLQWTDRYPFTAEFKGGSFKISPKRFYITSNFSFIEMFRFHPQMEAFNRRFHKIDFDKNTITKRPRFELEDKSVLIDF